MTQKLSHVALFVFTVRKTLRSPPPKEDIKIACMANTYAKFLAWSFKTLNLSINCFETKIGI